MTKYRPENCDIDYCSITLRLIIPLIDPILKDILVYLFNCLKLSIH